MSQSTVPLVHPMHMLTRWGLYEHADGNRPRTEHGFCTDDNARLLLAMARGRPTPAMVRLSAVALSFLVDAQGAGGSYPR